MDIKKKMEDTERKKTSNTCAVYRLKASGLYILTKRKSRPCIRHGKHAHLLLLCTQLEKGKRVRWTVNNFPPTQSLGKYENDVVKRTRREKKTGAVHWWSLKSHRLIRFYFFSVH